MADLHPLVLLAQRLAEGRRQHPSNAAFGQWVKDNGLGHLTHRDRAALLRIAQLDPQEASARIGGSSYTTAERLWYRALRPMRKTPAPDEVAVRKATPEPFDEHGAVNPVVFEEMIEDLLERLADAGDDVWRGTGSRDFYDFFDLHVVALAGMLTDTLEYRAALTMFESWLEQQQFYDLDESDRRFMTTIIAAPDAWQKVIMRKMPC